MKYSIVIPIHNEAGNIRSLHTELCAITTTLDGPTELIFVNDGSTDNSLAELLSLPGITLVDLNRNYGQATALDAGFKIARGEIVISIDGDGQNDPRDIPHLLSELTTQELDVVAGWRKVRQDRAGIKILTTIGRQLRRLLIKDKIHDTGCTLRVYRKKAAQSLDLQGEMHRYIIALLRWKGFRIGEVIVRDRPRLHGRSKYGLSKSIRGFIDLLFIWFIHKYSQRPLHLFGYASLIVFAGGLCAVGYAAYEKLVFDVAINRSGYFLLGGFSLLGALLLFSFGIVIDLLIRIYLIVSPHEKRYTIRAIFQQKP
jgi:glycosyltransferase involved in cell wall biosynthesis